MAFQKDLGCRIYYDVETGFVTSVVAVNTFMSGPTWEVTIVTPPEPDWVITIPPSELTPSVVENPTSLVYKIDGSNGEGVQIRSL